MGEEIITITYDDKIKTVALDDFVRQSLKMLDEFGLHTNEGMVRSQIRNIMEGKKLNVIGVYLKSYIVTSEGIREGV